MRSKINVNIRTLSRGLMDHLAYFNLHRIKYFVLVLFPKRAKIGLGGLTVTESREKVVDFSVPFMYYTEEMLLKKTSSNGRTVDLLQFMNPFHNDIWLATLVTLVIISVAVFVINYFSPYGYKDENGRGTSEEFSFSNSVWFALGCMLQQGAENQPRSLSGDTWSHDLILGFVVEIYVLLYLSSPNSCGNMTLQMSFKIKHYNKLIRSPPPPPPPPTTPPPPPSASASAS